MPQPATSPITTHVLDLVLGRPAQGLGVVLQRRTDDGWVALGRGSTDDDGRLTTLLPPDHRLAAGDYRLEFATGAWFAARSGRTFFPEVVLTFAVDNPHEHFHVPLLLGPFSYSTYRGS